MRAEVEMFDELDRFAYLLIAFIEHWKLENDYFWKANEGSGFLKMYWLHDVVAVAEFENVIAVRAVRKEFLDLEVDFDALN